MAVDATEIVVAGTGKVQVAPYGTTLPDGTTAVFESLDAAFIDLGYTTEDGVTFTDAINVTDLPAWQTPYPVRRLVEGYESSAVFTLMQWNKDIFEQIFYGVVTETVVNTVHKFTPTRDGTIPEKSLVIDFEDGNEDYRFVIPRVGMAEAVEVPLVRSGAAVMPTNWGVIGGDAAGAWFLLTSDQNFSID